MKDINILLIGLGNMGKVHKRIIENTKNVSLVGILDSSFNDNFLLKIKLNTIKNLTKLILILKKLME